MRVSRGFGRNVRLRRRSTAGLAVAAGVVAVVASAAGGTAQAGAVTLHEFQPDNLLVSRTVYTTAAGAITPGVTVLPPGCTTGCVTATDDASYPGVWNNEQGDPSFGVASPIFLDQLTPSGWRVSSLEVASDARQDHVVTSFASKSELALNLSTDGRYVTFMGYVAPTSALDVSNSNTPAVFDPTNPDPGSDYRAVAQVDADGKFQFTESNAFSGDNGRAAIRNDSDGVYYMAGNAGNGGKPQPVGVITGTGAQIMTPQTKPEKAQQPGAPTPVGSFNITQLGQPADKIGKDTNFRGLTIHDNVVYLTKGSGSNGVNTVYFIDTTGKACPNGVGVPQPGAKLPTSSLSYDPSTVQAQGLPNNMCILAGFPTALKSDSAFPFGLWFADDNTLYVADEGNGDSTYDAATNTYTTAAGQTTAGLQKWARVDGTWKLAYTITDGLNLGSPYSVARYPTGNNAATGLPWAPATDGLRNITGRVNSDGTVTVWAVTSTVSGAGDPGADPNKVVAVTDPVRGAAPAAHEHFVTIDSARAGETLRGVSLTPGSTSASH